jgi:hypothetical protein
MQEKLSLFLGNSKRGGCSTIFIKNLRFILETQKTLLNFIFYYQTKIQKSMQKAIEFSAMPVDPFKGNRVTIYQYLGHIIPFEEKNGTIMVNATLMAKAYGKSTNSITRHQRWADYVQEVKEELDNSDKLISVSTDYQSLMGDPNCTFLRNGIPLVLVKKGGNAQEQGTWVHQEVALEFARSLDTKLARWCDKVLKELMAKGTVNIDTVPAPQPTKSIQERADELIANDDMAIFDVKVSVGISKLANEKSNLDGGTEACIQDNAEISRLFSGRVPSYIKQQYKEPKKAGLQILREREPEIAAAITFAKVEKIKGDLTLDQLVPFKEPIKKVCSDLFKLRNQLAEAKNNS